MASYNPWMVHSVHDFWFLKCPECSFDSKEEENFQAHALEKHPLSFTLFGKTVKEEAFDNNYEFAENNKDYPEASENQDPFLEVQIKEEFVEKKGTLDQAKDHSKNEEKTYPCKFCNHTSAKKSGIVNHISQHHELTSKSMKRHIQLLHENERPYTCDLCGLSFVLKTTWKAHINQKCKNRIERNNKRITVKGKCPVCKEVFESNALKIKHVTEKHPERKIYDCLFCETKFVSLNAFHLHLSQKHEKEHGPDIFSSLPVPKKSVRICPICKRVFKTRTKMMEHYALVHPEAPMFNCSQCEEKYLSLNGIQKHVFFSHERKVTDLGCSFCGKEFTLKQELNNHIATDHKEKKYECSKCEASYGSYRSLLSHIEKDHELKKYQCTTCGEVFESITKLESHIALKHDRTKLFKCHSCNASYLTKKKLDEHISFVHNKSSGHLCPQCGENFQEKRRMKEHIIVVHEGKGFDCQFCNKTFNSTHSRQNHIKKIHEGWKPKPKKCSQCDKIFVTSSTLKIHTDTVHEKKRPYACHLCELSFTQSGNLKTHIKGKHKEFIFTGKVKNGSFLSG